MTPSRGSGRSGSKRLALAGALLALLLLAGLVGCGTERPAQPSAHVCAVPAPANPTLPLAVDPGARGTADFSRMTVLGFSQVGNADPPDPQVLQLDPDLLIRGWQRWDRWGVAASEYNAGYPAAAHAQGIAFVGGSTASALFRDEAASDAEFRSLVACDARGRPVLRAAAGTAFYRASLASPAYRRRLIDYGKMQIDAGVDGLFYDEVSSSYDGARWDGNEGFDDAHLADFGGFLCSRYGGLAATELASRFRLEPGELDCSGPAETRGRSFDYRAYLSRNGWLDAPLSTANPLAADWGRTLDNRPDPDVGSFVQTYPSLVYWQEIAAALRSYAREVHGREIFLTSNGIYPFVDFQSVGLYDWNQDGPGGKEVNYVPVVNGHLDGATSLLPAFLALKQRSARIAGPDVPVALFLDWPAASMDRYTGLPSGERKDYFRIFLAEAYAAGLFYALPLKTTTGEPTASELGMMDFFGQLAAFYRGHAELYHGARDLTDPVTVSLPAVTSHLTRLADGRTVLHLINHQYVQGLQPRTGVEVTFPAPQEPLQVTSMSPDLAADVPASFTYDLAGRVHVNLPTLDAYLALVAE